MRLLHRGYWWYRRFTNKVARIGNVDFLFISADGDVSSDAILKNLRLAFEEIAFARAGFGELVGSHLRFVAAQRMEGSFAMPLVRGFVSGFSGPEADNPHYLAARLVYASTYIRLWRDASGYGRAHDLGAIRSAAHEAQIRFLNQIPGSEALIAYIEQHGSPTG